MHESLRPLLEYAFHMGGTNCVNMFYTIIVPQLDM